MLTYFPVGPTEDQTYQVAYMTPGTRVASIVLEHLNERDAIGESKRLNDAQVAREKADQLEAHQIGMRRIQRDLQGAV
jgi:hypothetical protein